jgi:hypothetical protein
MADRIISFALEPGQYETCGRSDRQLFRKQNKSQKDEQRKRAAQARRVQTEAQRLLARAHALDAIRKQVSSGHAM